MVIRDTNERADGCAVPREHANLNQRVAKCSVTLFISSTGVACRKTYVLPMLLYYIV